MYNVLHENFLKAVESLGLRFPVATISKDTGYNTSIVSEYLNSKKQVSEKFAKVFCEVYNLDFAELKLPAVQQESIQTGDEELQFYTPGKGATKEDIAQLKNKLAVGDRYEKFKTKFDEAALPMILFDHEERITRLEMVYQRIQDSAKTT